MPAASLAKVFGPTIVGHGCANPEPSVMWQDTQKQPKVGEYLSIAAFTAMKAWMLSSLIIADPYSLFSPPAPGDAASTWHFRRLLAPVPLCCGQP